MKCRLEIVEHGRDFNAPDLPYFRALGDRLVFLAPSPSTILGDVRIDLPHETRDAAQIEAFKRVLQRDYPQLTGLL